METAEQASDIVHMHCQRWAIENAFKAAKTCLRRANVQALAYEAGGCWSNSAARRGPPQPATRQGVSTQCLRRLLDLLAAEAILAAMLGRAPAQWIHVQKRKPAP